MDRCQINDEIKHLNQKKASNCGVTSFLGKLNHLKTAEKNVTDPLLLSCFFLPRRCLSVIWQRSRLIKPLFVIARRPSSSGTKRHFVDVDLPVPLSRKQHRKPILSLFLHHGFRKPLHEA